MTANKELLFRLLQFGACETHPLCVWSVYRVKLSVSVCLSFNADDTLFSQLLLCLKPQSNSPFEI